MHTNRVRVGRSRGVAATLRYLPLAVLLAFVVLRFAAQGDYDRLVDEDGPVEWATVAVYAAATLLAVGVVGRLYRRGLPLAALLYVLVAVALFFIASEEISWGQRQLGFEGPAALVEENKQSEANLHNLLSRYKLHLVYILVGLYGAGLGRWTTLRVALARPWAWLLAPGLQLRWYFAVVVVVYGWFDYLSPLLVRVVGAGADPKVLELTRLQEVAELGLGVGFLAFVWAVYRAAARPRHSQHLSAAGAVTGVR